MTLKNMARRPLHFLNLNSIFLCGLLLFGALLRCPAQSNRELHNEGMEKLAFLQGSWQVNLFRKAKDGSFQFARSIAINDPATPIEFKSIFKGNYFQVSGELGYYFTLTIGYDQWRDKYVLVSFEDGPGLVDIYQGNFDAKGDLVLTNLEAGTHYVHAGEKHFNRMIFTSISSTGFTWYVDDSIDGKEWKRASRYEFTR